jgi:nickel-dependent lactate racemase
MRVEAAFGKRSLSLELPDGPRYEVLEARSARALSDVGIALADALDSPIGRPPLKELARDRKTAAISVCDITRPAPNKLTLPPILDRLHAAGITAEDVTILIATGLHRPSTSDELDVILGREIASRYRVVNHNAREIGQHHFLGKTARGTPVYIDERFIAADLHITLGFIEQHLMLGFSGGRKLVAPGLAAQDTIKVLHSPLFMREPKAIEGSIDDNPLHQELLEIARMARHDFMLDVALTRTRDIAGVFAGDPVEAHAAGVRFVSESLLETIPEPVDAVITTAAGYPLDLTFYQAVKGITAAQHILKPGGKILLIAECDEGAGAREFAEKLRHLKTYESFLDELKAGPVTVDQWQLEKLALVGTKFDVLFYTPGLAKAASGGLAVKMYDSVGEALQALTAGLPANARIAVIPEGPYVYARVAETVAA